ncbi:MAG: molybdopterin-dependent oxidoreductase, partial [Thermoleophilaceae bacterium]|nr:molybdopterin-dependent oxidoreductase [Thermoleophilaceae bacterium]
TAALAPGLNDPAETGHAAETIASALAAGDLSALVLLQADPLATHPDRGGWLAALERAGLVIAFADFLDEGLAEHADVVFPAEVYAEKEGTVTHPDGRLQRVRQAVKRPGEVRPQALVLAELAARIEGCRNELISTTMVTAAITEAVGIYAGLTLAEIGGRGVRWQDRNPDALPDSGLEPVVPGTPPRRPEGLALGTVRSLWTGRETRHAPALRFLAPHQRAELSVADGERLGVRSGDEVEVGINGTRVRATVALRSGLRPGAVFLIEGTDEHNANVLTNGSPRVVEVRKL